jgi:hypothetical protein
MRNLNPHKMFMDWAAEHRPLYRFDQMKDKNWQSWQQKAWPEVVKCLGDFPSEVPLNPELIVEWEERGLRMQRWVIDVHPYLSAILQINIPGDLKDGEQRPAILCWHGHSEFGKEAVMGNESSQALKDAIKRSNNDYGFQMAKAGFVTFAIDWMGIGQRRPGKKGNHAPDVGGRDWCNLLYLHATMFGTTSLALNIAQGMAVTTFVAGLPEVKGDCLGVMGVSGGGTMAIWSYLYDKRFKAGEVICYCDLWEAFGIRDHNYCGMQVAPGLYKLVDLPDLLGLLAPRPLLLDIGIHDTCFTIESTMPAYRRVEEIYKAANASERLELDLHPGEHGWGGNLSKDFFTRYLV